MEPEIVRRIWDELHDLVGEDLRVVTWYDPEEFETVMREDVRERYTATDDRTIVDDTIIRQLRHRETEAAFDVGSLEGVTLVFEEALVTSRRHPDDDKRGLIVSIQRTGAGAAALDDVFRYLDDLAWDWLEE